MLKLLERNVAAIERRLVVLAPPQAQVPETFSELAIDPSRHQRLVREMQQLRGSIYLQGGYVTANELSADGRHHTREDEKSWHLLMTDAEGRITSCAWYLEHETTASVQHLRVRKCPFARSDEWRDTLFAAVESELARARRAGLRYAEVGGWAVCHARRCTSEALVLALAAYGLCRMLGGAIGMTMANVTHASSSILRRVGLTYLEHNGTTLPAYFDPKYNTMIELLRFDSRHPNPKFAPLVDMLRDRLGRVTVVAPDFGWDYNLASPTGLAQAEPALVAV